MGSEEKLQALRTKIEVLCDLYRNLSESQTLSCTSPVVDHAFALGYAFAVDAIVLDLQRYLDETK